MPKRAKSKGRRESGTFILLPHSIVRHENFVNLSPRATKLFLDLAACYTGFNNGDFSCAWTQMKKRGWKSRDQLFKAQKELMETGFIVKTRQGGRNKCNLFALTIWPIDECKGKLDIPATHVAPGDWKKSTSVTRNKGDRNPNGGLMSKETGLSVH